MLTLNHIYSSSWTLAIRIILSLIYSPLIYFRNKLYDWGIYKIYKIDTAVVSVGNVSVGGSGKTILTQTLLDFFLSHGMRPSVLSRGYARKSSGSILVSDGNSLLADVSVSGDEPFLMATNFPGVPVMVSEDRVAGALELEREFQPDVIVLDDGFQHRRLGRDIDILLVDKAADQRTHLLPWGDQREHASALNRSSITIYSKEGLRANGENNLVITPPIYCYDHSTNEHILSDMSGTYGVFAGLGNPASFFLSIRTLLGPSKAALAFADHVEYTSKTLTEITEASCDFWLTTQKDMVKLSSAFCEKNRVYFVKASTPLPEGLRRLLKQHFKQ